MHKIIQGDLQLVACNGLQFNQINHHMKHA